MGSNEQAFSARFGGNTNNYNVEKLIRKWMSCCESDHSDCQLGHNAGWLPTRLLELTEDLDDKTVRVRLRTTHRGYSQRYITLTHRWDDSDLNCTKLTRSNLTSLQSGIDVDSLPQTFQDVIRTTLKLGVPNLWIDRLCIIQDDESDWQKEAGMMGKVYQNGYINISAIAGAATSNGLFSDRDPSHIKPWELWRKPNPGAQFVVRYILVPSDVWKEVEDALLNHRGWVLQERILSPRTVYFCSTQVYWECRQLRCSETFSEGITADFRDKTLERLAKKVIPGRDLRDYGGQVDDLVRNCWSDILARYTASSLTFNSDKLIALSGLAREVRKIGIRQTNYVAGMWRDHLPLELLWSVPSPVGKSSPVPYIAPSWSWASTSGCIALPRTFKGEKEDYLAKIIECEARPVNPHEPYGQVSAGHVRLRGKLANVIWPEKQHVPIPRDVHTWTFVPLKLPWQIFAPGVRRPEVGFNGFEATCPENGSIINYNTIASFDDPTFEAKMRSAYLLPLLRKVKNHGRPYQINETETEGLLLRQVPSTGDFYRIGTLTVLEDIDKRLMDTLVEREIRVV